MSGLLAPGEGQSPASAFPPSNPLSAFSPRPPHSPSGLARYHASSPRRPVRRALPILRLRHACAATPAPRTTWPPPQKRSLEDPLSADHKSSHSSLRLSFPHPHRRAYNRPEDAEFPPEAPEGRHIAVRDAGTLGTGSDVRPAHLGPPLSALGRRRGRGPGPGRWGAPSCRTAPACSARRGALCTRSLPKATRPIRNFLPQTRPTTPGHRVELPRGRPRPPS